MNRSIQFLLLWIATSHGFSTTSRSSSSSRSRTLAFTPSHRPSLIQLQDVLVNDDRHNSRRRPMQWPRRIWSRIVRKNAVSKKRRSARSLRMVSMDQETQELMGTSIGDQDQAGYASDATSDDSFILRNIQELTPDMVGLSKHPKTLLDSEFYNVRQEAAPAAAVAPSSTTTTQTPLPSSSTSSAFRKNISIARGLAMVVENVLTGLITRHAIEIPEELAVQASTHGHLVPNLLTGQFSTQAKISVGRLVFPIIRMSSATLHVKHMTLNLMGFTHKEQSRFPKQFELHVDDLTFSRHDLLFSPCIRNGLRRLLVRVLRDRGVQTSTVKVTSVDILPSGKIACKGEATTLFGAPLSFEVRSGISTSSRGHVLTFPGLEISLNRDLGFFVPVVPELDLDVGHNARFRNIHIDGPQKRLELSASVTITPESTFRLNDYRQSSQAFSAKFSTDVGRWLTKIGNFDK